MDRDYVWEADYGKRTKLTLFMKELLNRQDSKSLQTLGIFVNNNPYNLELFIFVSYDNPKDDDILFMKEGYEKLGLIYRSDITFDKMLEQMSNRRYDYRSFADAEMVDWMMENSFAFAERQELERLGYQFKPFGKRKQIFISHASVDKVEIEKIVPFLNAINVNVWVDKYNINVGDSIEKKVFEGIDNSNAVIFWITKDFLKSSWCKEEMEQFINRAYDEDVLIISVIDVDVDIEELPENLKGIKYIKKEKNEFLEVVVAGIVETLKKKYSIRQEKGFLR